MSVVDKARPGGGPGSRPGGRRRRGPLLLLLALVAGLGLLLWLRGGEPTAPPEAAEQARPEAPLPPRAAAEPAQEPPAAEEGAISAAPAAEPLPPLAESDSLLRELARGVSRDPLFLRLLADAGLIDRFVLVVDNLAEGVVPRAALAPLRPAGAFRTTGREPALHADPASYRRYDALAAAIASLDAEAAAAAYERVAPLCEESYRALGYPAGGFAARLRAALALLVATPLPAEEPLLVAETLRFEFADPALEGLADAQKQLLRLGPANAERVVRKLREIEAALR